MSEVNEERKVVWFLVKCLITEERKTSGEEQS